MGLFDFCWHRWGKYSAPSETIMCDGTDYGMGYFAVIQERTCEKCGMVQTHRLPGLRRLESATKDRK
jgi:hypothetical protein